MMRAAKYIWTIALIMFALVLILAPLLLAGTPDRAPWKSAWYRARQSSGPWTPAELDLWAWYDASVTSTITTNANGVTQWNDIAGTQHVWQTSSSSQPDTGVDTLNGLNVLTFSTTDFLQNSTYVMPDSGNFTIFNVSICDSPTTDAEDSFWGFFNGIRRFHIESNNTTNFMGETRVAFYGSDRIWSGGPYNGPSVYAVVANLSGGVHRPYVDGTAVGNNATYSTRVEGVNFRVHSQTYNRHMPGKTAEVIIIEDVSTNTVQRIEGYLAWKWGLEGNLPSGHPYKDAAP